MTLREIQLSNFKKFSNLKISFNSNAVAIVGGNATGKTTILEAILHLSTGKGSQPAGTYVKKGEGFFRVKGVIIPATGGPPSEVVVFYDASKREKKILVNKKLISRLANLIGLMPTISLNMHSFQWVWGPVEWRRKQVDLLLAQANKTYLETLIKHYRVLEQRNKALRTTKDKTLLITYGQLLFETSSLIRRYRNKLINDINEMSSQLLDYLLPHKKHLLNLKYHHHSDEDWENKLDREMELGYTLWGAQRDQITWEADGQDAASFLSRGEGSRLSLTTVIALWLWLSQHKKEVTFLVDDWEAFQDKKYLNAVPSFLLEVKPHNSSIFLTSWNILKGSHWQQVVLKQKH